LNFFWLHGRESGDSPEGDSRGCLKTFFELIT
jgi:hypothetical protein